MNGEIVVWIIGVGLLVGLGAYISNLHDDIGALELDNAKLTTQVATHKLESERLRNAVAIQNKFIASMQIDIQKATDEIEQWRSQPPRIKYKTITKVREIKSDDCQDIKSTLDAVRGIEYDSL